MTKNMLENKIALVTGASRGIGKAIAEELAGSGATVIVNYNGSKDAAENLVEEIIASGGEAVAYRCNVADASSCETMIREIQKTYGRIDILVNNAGIVKDNLLIRMSEEEFDAVVDTNLKGTFHTMKHISKIMLKQRSGRIINMASVVGLTGNLGQANYAASKAGIIGLTKSAARELASRNITVNAIAPGFIRTDMTDQLKEAVKDQVLGQIPMGRMGEPKDIAKLVGFLASEDAAYITGQIICVDGGMVM